MDTWTTCAFWSSHYRVSPSLPVQISWLNISRPLSHKRHRWRESDVRVRRAVSIPHYSKGVMVTRVFPVHRGIVVMKQVWVSPFTSSILVLNTIIQHTYKFYINICFTFCGNRCERLTYKVPHTFGSLVRTACTLISPYYKKLLVLFSTFRHYISCVRLYLRYLHYVP